MPGLTATAQTLAAESHASPFDLSVHMSQTATGIGGVVRYRTDQLDDLTVDELIDDYQVALRTVAAHHDWTLTAIASEIARARAGRRAHAREEQRTASQRAVRTARRSRASGGGTAAPTPRPDPAGNDVNGGDL